MFHPLSFVIGVIVGEMRVPIHESGRKRRVAEIDHLRVSWRAQIASGIDDFAALNDDNAVLHECFRLAIEQTRRF